MDTAEPTNAELAASLAELRDEVARLRVTIETHAAILRLG